MTPDEFRAAFIKSRGLNLNSAPIPVAAPTPVQTIPITPTDVIPGAPATDPTAPPFRMPEQSAVDKWRAGVDTDPMTHSSPATPRIKPGAFPTSDVAPVANVSAPTGPGGITLNSAPIAPGWAGTVGLPNTPEAAKSFTAGQNYSDLLGGLGEMAKGAKPKPAATDLNTITPMSQQPNAGIGGAQELLAQLLQNRRRNYGISLTG